MAKSLTKTLTALSIEALLKMRDEIGSVLGQKADVLKKELQSIGADYKEVGRIAIYGKKSLKGSKVAPKYRGPDGELWAGRGAQPRWMTAAIKSGKKRDDFLIAKPAKKSAPKKKRKKKA